LAGTLGPGMYICYIIGLIPALGMGLTYAQLGSAIPVTSGQYSYMCMFIHPAVGFLFNWGSLLAGCSITATVCMGITGYLGAYFPSVPPVVFSLGILILFTVLHIIGLKSAEIVQTLMVVIMVVVLALFIFMGFPNMKPELNEPLFPNGTSALISGAASLFFSYLGFNTVTDIGEEIKNPSRNIPLSICLSAGIVGFLYIGVAYVMPRLIPYTELAANNVGLADAAAEFFPWLGFAITIAAIFAILTSVSACVAQNSRAWFVMGRDGWLPKFIAKKNSKDAPVGAILVLFAISAAIILTGWDLTYAATMGSVALLLGTAIVAWFPIFLPKKFPEQYEKAQFKLPMAVKVAFAAVTCIVSLVLCFATVKDFMVIWIFIAVWMIPGAGLYWYGKKRGLKDNA
ncbi:MAG: APC family permease, partial [Firmicutes bacterium]|nr:APC family permease [Bacillota bacterium]